jgi:hypothetical protein
MGEDKRLHVLVEIRIGQGFIGISEMKRNRICFGPIAFVKY